MTRAADRYVTCGLTKSEDSYRISVEIIEAPIIYLFELYRKSGSFIPFRERELVYDVATVLRKKGKGDR